MTVTTEYVYESNFNLHQFKYNGPKRFFSVTIDDVKDQHQLVPKIYQGLHDLAMNICFDFQLFSSNFPWSDNLTACRQGLHDQARIVSVGYANFIVRVMAYSQITSDEITLLSSLVRSLESVGGMASLFKFVKTNILGVPMRRTVFISNMKEEVTDTVEEVHCRWKLTPLQGDVLSVEVVSTLSENLSGACVGNYAHSIHNWDEPFMNQMEAAVSQARRD